MVDDEESNVFESQCRQLLQEYLQDYRIPETKEEDEEASVKQKVQIVKKDVPETQVTSLDPAERILARRQRILRRQEYLDRTQAEQIKENVVEKHIRKANEKLHSLEQKLLEPVCNIRLAGQMRESRRKKREEVRAKKRRKHLDDLAKGSLYRFRELCEGWEQILMQHEDPLDLQSNLMEHNSKCEELIDQKDAIIKELQVELKIAHEKIDKDEEMSRNDLTAIGDKVVAQEKIMRKAYLLQLELLEKVIDAYVIKEIHKLDISVEKLTRLRNFKQLKYSKRTTDMKLDLEREQAGRRRELQEELNKMRNELECDELDMEYVSSDVLGQCVVNAAKIFYNVEVLKGRVVENEYLITYQTRRLRHVSTEARFLQNEIHRLEREMQTETERVHQEVRILYKRILDNHKRMQISKAYNDKQYRQLWRLNRANIMRLATKVLQIDRIIHEQHLGLKWTPVLNISTEMGEFANMPSYSSAVTDFKPLDERNDADEESIKKTEKFEERGARLFMPIWKLDEEVATTDEGMEQERFVPQPAKRKVTDQLLSHLMEQMSESSAFIVGQHLLDLLQPYEGTARDFVKLDSLFRALGVEKKQSLLILGDFFLPYANCSVCQDRKTRSNKSDVETQAYLYTQEYENEGDDDEEEEEMKDMHVEGTEEQQEHQDAEGDVKVRTVRFRTYTEIFPRKLMRKTSAKPSIKCWDPWTHPLTVRYMHVPLALNDFAAAYSHMCTVSVPSIEERLAHTGRTLSRALVPIEVTAFWMRWRDVLPQTREQIWDAFLIGVKRYYHILKDRYHLNRKLRALKKQNADFKHLLKHCQEESNKIMKNKSSPKIHIHQCGSHQLPRALKPKLKNTTLKSISAKSPRLPSIYNP